MPYIILKKERFHANSNFISLSNIESCIKIADFIRTTLGPSSMDKIISINKTENIITNDGATVLSYLNISHPVAKILVEISKSQDFEVGDGTTSVCLFSAELLSAAKNLIEEGIHPKTISKCFRKSGLIAAQMLDEISEKQANTDLQLAKKTLMSCCATSLNSKLISGKRHVFSEMIVNICTYMGNEFDSNMIGVKSVVGGSVNDSFFIKGIAIKKPFTYAGFEKQFKKYYFPNVLAINIELELKTEKNNAESRIKTVKNYQSIIDAEWSIIYEKLDRIANSKAKVVFSKLPIGDLATQYFAERGILCGGRIPNDDMIRIAKGSSAQVITSISSINIFALGKCNLIEERQIGGERFLIMLGCKTESVTIILRGASNNLLDEAKRCLNDGMMVVKKAMKNRSIVAGAGATEMRLSCKLRKYANTLNGQDQLIISKYAQALEIIPRTICENAGLDFMSLISELRYNHNNHNNWNGIDIEKGKMFDAYENYIWEPVIVKSNAIQAATEAACTILTIDNILSISEKDEDV
nr:T-complex protein1 eta SU [Cryptomonas sp.]